MILGFQPSFVPYVRDGSKTHTIRKYDHRNWRVGRPCDCYENVRQKNMALIGRWPCTALDDIVIELLASERLYIEIGGTKLSRDEIELLAWKDGFRPEHLGRITAAAPKHKAVTAELLMRRWWQFTHGTFFNGRVIHWDFAIPLYRTAKGKYGALKP